ncbi:MAG: ABC transporter substrate-binding protein, partial [Chitinivibrionales bacterium]|nr:ABC transporter substrate-binding protein [Chitinivibrionales bacterium]
YKPHIAKSWTISSDGLIWTFAMRDDVFFSDGVKLSAHDVVFTFNDIIYNDKLNSPLNYNFRIQEKKISVAALDSFTVQFALPFPFAPFFTVAGMSIMPRHRYEKFAKDGTLEAHLSSGTKPENVVGTGSFMLETVELGQRVVLKRNPNYWRKDNAGNRLPYLDKISFLVIKEPNVQMLKFKAGEIDQLLIQGEHYPILKPIEKEAHIRLYKVGPRWYESFFTFNQNNQKDESTGKYFLDPKKQNWFRNKYFRQACAFAINYDEIINIVYNGLAHQPSGIWGRHKGFFHNPDAAVYPYDTAKARLLLAQNGFKDTNGDGYLEDKDGNIVEFTIMSSAGVQVVKNLCELIRKDLEQIGLKVHLNLVEFNNMIDKVQNTFDWDVVSFSLGGIIDPHFGKSSVISTSFRYDINPQRKDKKEKLITKEDRPWELRINEIFEIAVSEMDRQKRKALYDEWQMITMDQCLKIYLPTREVILGVQDRFENIHLTKYLAQTEGILHNMDEIYIRQ